MTASSSTFSTNFRFSDGTEPHDAVPGFRTDMLGSEVLLHALAHVGRHDEPGARENYRVFILNDGGTDSPRGSPGADSGRGVAASSPGSAGGSSGGFRRSGSRGGGHGSSPSARSGGCRGGKSQHLFSLDYQRATLMCRYWSL